MPRRSLALYPGRPASVRQHRLGLWDGYQLAYLDGDDWRGGRVDDYPAFVAVVLANKLDVRCDSVLGFPWLREALADKRATVNATQSRADLHAQIVSITWREGNKWGSLFSAQSWGDGATNETVTTHHQTCTHLAAGVYASPSALGQATIRAKLDTWHTTLPQPAQTDLLDNLAGGRAELASPGYYPIAYEIDRRMAYVAEATNPLPVGAPVCIGEIGLEHVSQYPFWFGRCKIIVTQPLARGPFPFRLPSGRLTFPTDAGVYTSWLWNQEADDCIKQGCLVFPERVWAWERSDPALRSWAEWIYERRMNAPTVEVAAYVKKVAVAALGWFAMRGQRLRVQLATDNLDERIIVNGDGWPTSYVAVPDESARPSPIMPHWASYIWMMARRSLYAEHVAQERAGNVVLASDFDSLLLSGPSTQHLAPSTLGGWRERMLTNVQLSVPRHLVSSEKVKRPGVAVR